MKRFFLSLKIVAFILVIFSFLRMIFYVRYEELFSDLSFFETLLAFINGIRFDLSSIMVFILIPLLMINLPLKKVKAAWVNFWVYTILVLLFLATFVLVGDMIYYDLPKRHLANELLFIIEDFSYIVEMALHYWYMLVAMAFYGFLLYKIGKKYFTLKRDIIESRGVVAAFFLVVVLIVLSMRGTLGGGKAINVIDAYGIGKSSYGNLSLNGLFTAYHFLRASKKEQIPHFFDTKTLYKNLGFDTNERYPFMKRLKPLQGGQKNVVIILLESWSAKYIGALGAKYGVTPHFDALTQEGRLYTNFYANGQRSIQGIQSIFTGILPLSQIPSLGFGLEVYNFSRIGAMASALGYETLFMQSSNRRSFRMDAIAKSLGFKYYYGKEDFPLLLKYAQDIPHFGWDYETLNFFKKRIDTLKEPFIAFVFTGTTHVPYADVPKRFHKYKHDALGEGGFLNTLFYADWALGSFFKEAKKMPWFNNTIFILTADHALGSFQGKGFKERFHTPLLIIDGAKLTKQQSTQYASQVDIMPTIAHIIGYNKPFASFGTSLFDEKNRKVVVTEQNTIALISQAGYLRHNLQKALESTLPQSIQKPMQNYLLSAFELTIELLKENRWLK